MDSPLKKMWRLVPIRAGKHPLYPTIVRHGGGHYTAIEKA
jgi:hypothetical protein